MPRVVVIVNPAGGRGRAWARWNEVASIAGPDVAVRTTDAPGHATEIARESAVAGVERIVACGGDGTINEVGNGLVGSPSALALLPAGTANDLAKTVGLPVADRSAAWHVAKEGPIKPVDAGLAVGHRHFFNIAGAGFDAEVVRRMEASPEWLKRLGVSPRYWLAIFSTFAKYRGAEMEITVDGEPQPRRRILLLAAGVARYYGGGMMMLPQAELDDGLIDGAWGSDLSWLELMSLMKKIYTGDHVHHPKVGTCQAREVRIEGGAGTAFHLDGDIVGELPVTFRVVPGSLNLVVPPGT